MELITSLSEAVELAFRFEVIIAILCGLVLGVCIGAIPGLTTATAMAIILPVSFFMEPLIAIPFLMGIYKGGIYGGSIPAILIATPGTGASVATTFDGPALVRKGQARKALDMALYASVIGDFTSDCVTILLIGPIALLALLIGPPELVPIIMLALLVVVLVARGRRAGAVTMALFGMLLASVGRDPINFTTRLTFGIEQLEGGIPLLPMLVGLFAIPEIIRMVVLAKRPQGITSGSRQNDDRLSLPQLLKYKRTITRSTLIGTVFGMVPGVGQPVAAFTGYAAAKRASSESESFGKGSLEGIAAAEASNNAVNGPTLVPMLTLGIPGDKITALLMGAFVAHGLRPGPGLLEAHGVLLLAILLSMLVANILLLFVARILIPLVSRLVYLRPATLAPVVMILAFMGAYLYRSDPFDLYFVILFGLVGLLVKRLESDITPLVLGFIVAEPLEYALGQTISLAGPNVLTYIAYSRPIAFVLFVVFIATMLWQIIRFARAPRS